MTPKNTLIGLVVGLGLLAQAPTLAQQRAAASQAGRRSHAPQLAADGPQELRNLATFLGTWEGNGTVRMGDQTGTLHARWVCGVAAGGYGVRCSFTMTGVPGMATYSEDDLMGWNPNDRLYHWYSVTNAGEVHDHWGSFDGTGSTFQFQGTMNGHLFVEHIRFTMRGANEITLRATTAEGATETSVIEATVTRR